MIHICKICDYETDQSTHHKDHLNSKTHKTLNENKKMKIEKLTNKEIKTLLKDEGLKVGGKKIELVERYMEHIKHIKTHKNTDDVIVEEVDDVEEVEDVTVEEVDDVEVVEDVIVEEVDDVEVVEDDVEEPKTHLEILIEEKEKLKKKLEEIEDKIIELENKTTNSFKFIDLFSGIGGFHQALSSFGSQCVLACDIDAACRKNYKLNYDIEPLSDVKKIDIKTMPDFDILCGGFPCQPFSNAGNKSTFDDDRGLLFDEIIKIAIYKKPKFMFLENVKHILKVGDGDVLKYIKQKIDSADYHLQLFKMSPHEYGIPQQRERIYFVCVRKDIYNGKDIQIIKPEVKIDFKKYLDTSVDKKYNIQEDIKECLEVWDEMIKIFAVGEKISPTILINENYNNHSKEDYDNYPKWKQDYITKNKPLIKKYKKQFDKWYSKHKDILKKKEIFGKLEWQVGVIKENDSIFNYFIQIRQSGIRVKKAQYFPTLVAISQIPIYGKECRYITPKECSRLQSFPESYKIDSSDKVAYKQFGNAVNVSNVKTVIESTFKHYQYHTSEIGLNH